MNNKRIVSFLALLLGLMLFPAGVLAADFTIGTSPAQLEAPGTVTLNINITNDGSAAMENIFISGPGVAYSADGKVIKPGETLYFPLTGLAINQEMLGVPLEYTISWQESGDYKSKTLTTTVLHANEVALSATRTADRTSAPEGETIVLTYTLKNTGTVELKNVSIKDKKVAGSKAIASGLTIPGGSEKVITYEFKMGNSTVISKPIITYSTGRDQSEKTYEIPSLSLGMINANLEMEITQGETTASGTDFAIKLINNGNQTVKKITLADEQGKALNDEAFALAIGQERQFSYHVGPEEAREVRFIITGTDGTGEEYSEKSSRYTVRKYIDPTLLGLDFSASVVSPLDAAGAVTLLFTIENSGSVDMTDVVLSEAELGQLHTLQAVSPGSETVELSLTPGIARRLDFVLAATDPSGNLHEYHLYMNTPQQATLGTSGSLDDEPLIESDGAQTDQDSGGGILITQAIPVAAVIFGVLAAAAGIYYYLANEADKRRAAAAARRRKTAQAHRQAQGMRRDMPAAYETGRAAREGIRPSAGSPQRQREEARHSSFDTPQPSREPQRSHTTGAGQRTQRTPRPYRPSQPINLDRERPADGHYVPRRPERENNERPDPKLP